MDWSFKVLSEMDEMQRLVLSNFLTQNICLTKHSQKVFLEITKNHPNWIEMEDILIFLSIEHKI